VGAVSSSSSSARRGCTFTTSFRMPLSTGLVFCERVAPAPLLTRGALKLCRRVNVPPSRAHVTLRLASPLECACTSHGLL
jgi:hypothetical protein